jgi:hypothetical protein
MEYKGIEILHGEFFHLNKYGNLVFSVGKLHGKCAKDISTLEELHSCINYCFWILKKKDVSLVGKYTASAFIAELAPKLLKLERELGKKTRASQEEALKITEEEVSKPGTTYC